MRIYVTSLSRPHNVARMESLAGGAELVWCIPEEQVWDYTRAGARHFVTGPPGKPEKINAVLDQYGDDWCVFTDDDCRGMKMLTELGSRGPISLGTAAAEFIIIGRMRRDSYVGIACLTNPRFMSYSISSWGQTTGWFYAQAPNTPERHDPSFGVAHDIEFAARMCDRYGRIARPNYIQGDYLMGDQASHFREEHKRKAVGFARLVRLYPHLFASYTDDNIKYRRLPAPRHRAGSTGRAS